MRAEVTPIETQTQKPKDPVITFLRSATAAKLEVSRRSRRIQILESQCTRVTTALHPVAGGGGNDRETLLAELADARDEEDLAIRRELEQYRTVSLFIDHISDPISRFILRLRYLEGCTWTDAQRKLYQDGTYYSERHLRRLHGKALDEARTLWKNQGPWCEALTEETEEKA